MIKAFLFDLDGVFYVDNNIIPGALSTLKWLNEKNIRYKFITNNTTSSRLKLLNKLKNLGLSTEKENIISANFAGVLFLEKIGVKSCELILPESGIEDYKKFKIVKKNPEVIVVGDIGNNWTFELMNDLLEKILNGSKLIALHKGRYYQSKSGIKIDSGAFVSGLEHSASVEAKVIGKPQTTFFELASKDFKCDPNQIAMVGDDLINDIGGAKKMGYKSFLVKTGKFREKIYANSNIKPDYLIESILELPKFLISNNFF